MSVKKCVLVPYNTYNNMISANVEYKDNKSYDDKGDDTSSDASLPLEHSAETLVHPPPMHDVNTPPQQQQQQQQQQHPRHVQSVKTSPVNNNSVDVAPQSNTKHISRKKQVIRGRKSLVVKTRKPKVDQSRKQGAKVAYKKSNSWLYL
jgi:hypothetical protein